ncbi:hypothetical protein ACFL6K_02755 [Candidatus Latescibacterota bacterium]
MKIANENSFTCSHFKKNLRAFIDNELPLNIKTLFLEHVSQCKVCGRALSEMQNLKERLLKLERYSVTSEFDFRLKSSLRKEHEKKRLPIYSFPLFGENNISKLLAITAFAAVIFLGFVSIYNDDNSTGLPDLVRLHVDSYDGVDIIPEVSDSSVEEVNFVLETVKPSDVEMGIFQENPDGSVNIPDKTNNMTLISY